MANLFDFFTPEAGQRRRSSLERLVSGVERYIPPNLRPAAEAVVQMNPVQGISDAMSASGVAFDPAQTAEARRRAAVDMGVEMAMTLAPAALVRMGYLAAPAGLMETFATPSVDAAVDMGRNALSDAQYAVRSVAQGDPRGVIDAIRPSGQPQSLSAAIPVYQGRSRQNLDEFFNPQGVSWGTNDLGTAELFAGKSELSELYPNYPGQVYNLEFDLNNPMDVDISETLWSADKEMAKVAEAKAAGHDGLRIIHPSGKIDYVAFDPSQVRQIGSEQPKPTMRAFHGTPHDFDRFDMTRIGTGEGAQAYGHGLYFAESEPIAQHYRQKLSAVNSTPLEEVLMTMDGSPAAQARFDNDVRQAVSFASTSSSAEGAARDFAAFTGRDVTPDLVDAFERAMAEKGRMYEVNIQGSPDEFINYDARLDEQSDLVKDVLGTGVETAAARLQRAYTNEMFGGDMIGQDRATPREVSQGLLSRGIKGIRYLDASSRGMGYKINLSRKGKPYETEPIEVGSRRQAEALAKEYQEKGFDTNIEAIGNRNMVVFDDRLIEIVRKYGIAGAAALLGVSSADIEGALAQGMPAQPQTGLLQ